MRQQQLTAQAHLHRGQLQEEQRRVREREERWHEMRRRDLLGLGPHADDAAAAEVAERRAAVARALLDALPDGYQALLQNALANGATPVEPPAAAAAADPAEPAAGRHRDLGAGNEDALAAGDRRAACNSCACRAQNAGHELPPPPPLPPTRRRVAAVAAPPPTPRRHPGRPARRRERTPYPGSSPATAGAAAGPRPSRRSLRKRRGAMSARPPASSPPSPEPSPPPSPGGGAKPPSRRRELPEPPPAPRRW